jgi:ABC-type branched-subunit amino acid transport system ATPase component/branched-subunit amino acid ABC-type transport system permease component
LPNFVNRGELVLNDLLPFIVSGTATGAIYGLAGAGLVLTYKTSGLFNFGHGALATIAAYLFYFLHVDKGLGWVASFVVSVVVAGPLLGLAVERGARRLAPQRTAMKIVGTVGLILIVQGLGTMKYGPDLINVDNYLPKGDEFFRVGGVNIQYKFLIVTVIAIVIVAALYCLFRFSRLGLAMRAVVDDPDLLDIKGTNPVRVRRFAWMIGATLAALSGVLVLPLVGLEPIGLTFLVVSAFGAAAFGGFANIPLTFVGGLVIGIASDVSKNYILDISWLNGLPPSLPFIALIIVLLVLPRRKLVPPSRVQVRQALEWHAPPRVRIVTGLVVVVVFLLVPEFAGVKLGFYTVGLSQVIILLSLGLLVRTSGQVSLCHCTFAAIGAVAFSQLTVDHHVPWLIALLLAALVAVPVGAVLAMPAIRLSGLFLALATLGFAITVERLFYPLNFMFTPQSQGRIVPRPTFARGDTAYYYLVLLFAVAVALLMVLVHRGRLGRLLRGMSESPVAVSTAGLSTNVTKVLVFCLSAFLAAMSGVLYAASVQNAGAADAHFTSFASIILLASLAVAPFSEPWYAVFIGMTAVIPAYFTGSNTINIMNVLFGVFAVQVAMQGGPATMPIRLRSWFARFDRSGNRRPPNRDKALEPSRVDPALDGLHVEGLMVRFGGVTAVKDFSLHAPVGRITGLIGPNGAGKTTTFNACTGLVRPTAGKIKLHGKDISRLSPSARGRSGLGRTFQIMELCESLSVAENVALGHESGLAGRGWLGQVLATPTQRQTTQAATASALELCGISELADRQAGELSTGARRLVELARCLAGNFDLLLLDEPSSGLDREETAQFARVLAEVVAERGLGILLVEHDMSLVMNVCNYIYVLDFGVLLHDGDPDSVRSSALVRGAYLGSDHPGSAIQPKELEESTT